MSHDLPTFGPTGAIPCDENYTPFATVRMDLAVTREQLRAALAIGHAEQSGEPALDDMSVRDIRHEVETHLGACAVIQLDSEAGSLNARLSPELAAELDAAIDRAYTRPNPKPEVLRKTPRYGNGMVTLNTFDQGDVTVREPNWCTGHGWQPNPYRSDITHNSVKVKAGATIGDRGWVNFMQAYVSHAPYLKKRPEPHPVVSVDLDIKADFTAEEIPQVIRGLQVVILRLQKLGAEALHLRGGI